MEIIGLMGISIGGLLTLIGWIWLMVVSFKEGGILWAVLIFFFSWIAGLIFCIVYKDGWIPWALMIVGVVISVFGAVPMVLKNLDGAF